MFARTCFHNRPSCSLCTECPAASRSSCPSSQQPHISSDLSLPQFSTGSTGGAVFPLHQQRTDSRVTNPVSLHLNMPMSPSSLGAAILIRAPYFTLVGIPRGTPWESRAVPLHSDFEPGSGGRTHFPNLDSPYIMSTSCPPYRASLCSSPFWGPKWLKTQRKWEGKYTGR